MTDIKVGEQLTVFDAYGFRVKDRQPYEVLYAEKQGDRWYVELKEL